MAQVVNGLGLAGIFVLIGLCFVLVWPKGKLDEWLKNPRLRW